MSCAAAEESRLWTSNLLYVSVDRGVGASKLASQTGILSGVGETRVPPIVIACTGTSFFLTASCGIWFRDSFKEFARYQHRLSSDTPRKFVTNQIDA